MNYLALLADTSDSPQWFDKLLQPQNLPFVIIPVVIVGSLIFAGIVGWTALAITKRVIRHRERMAMLHHGIDPDAPLERQ